jgi:hypothetical protein
MLSTKCQKTGLLSTAGFLVVSDQPLFVAAQQNQAADFT